MQTFIIEYATSMCGDVFKTNLKKIEAQTLEEAKTLADELIGDSLDGYDELGTIKVSSIRCFVASLQNA